MACCLHRGSNVLPFGQEVSEIVVRCNDAIHRMMTRSSAVSPQSVPVILHTRNSYVASYVVYFRALRVNFTKNMYMLSAGDKNNNMDSFILRSMHLRSRDPVLFYH